MMSIILGVKRKHTGDILSYLKKLIQEERKPIGQHLLSDRLGSET